MSREGDSKQEAGRPPSHQRQQPPGRLFNGNGARSTHNVSDQWRRRHESVPPLNARGVRWGWGGRRGPARGRAAYNAPPPSRAPRAPRFPSSASAANPRAPNEKPPQRKRAAGLLGAPPPVLDDVAGPSKREGHVAALRQRNRGGRAGRSPTSKQPPAAVPAKENDANGENRERSRRPMTAANAISAAGRQGRHTPHAEETSRRRGPTGRRLKKGWGATPPYGAAPTYVCWYIGGQLEQGALR